jgi:hypothetical protein
MASFGGGIEVSMNNPKYNSGGPYTGWGYYITSIPEGI